MTRAEPGAVSCCHVHRIASDRCRVRPPSSQNARWHDRTINWRSPAGSGAHRLDPVTVSAARAWGNGAGASWMCVWFPQAPISLDLCNRAKISPWCGHNLDSVEGPFSPQRQATTEPRPQSSAGASFCEAPHRPAPRPKASRSGHGRSALETGSDVVSRMGAICRMQTALAGAADPTRCQTGGGISIANSISPRRPRPGRCGRHHFFHRQLPAWRGGC